MVKKSLLFSKVRVNSYCHIEESVILPNVNIGRNCKVIKAIIDSGCEIPEGMEIGINHDNDRRNGFRVTDKGVVLVTAEMLTALEVKD
jgi:glucose-1-phosphate adenylyltransferase